VSTDWATETIQYMYNACHKIQLGFQNALTLGRHGYWILSFACIR
jgi:hypothetical protein